MQRFRMRLAMISTLLALALAAGAGCSKMSGTATVQGTVTYKGKPLTAGVVTFIGQNNQVASCSIEPTGEYKVSNVPVGATTITVTVPPAATPPKGVKVPAGEESDHDVVHIPRTYAEVDKSGLTYTVQPGSQEHPIELK